MNGEGEFNPQAEAYDYLRGNLVTGFVLGSAPPGAFSPDIPLEEIYATISAGILAATGTGAFGVGVPPAVDTTGSPESTGAQAVVPVIDPESAPTSTVFETAGNVPPGDIILSDKPTDWGQVYEEFVILNPEIFVPVPVFQEPVLPRGPPNGTAGPGTSQEEVPVAAFDWGSLFTPGGVVTGALDYFTTPAGAVAGQSFMQAPVAQVPAKVTVDTRTGKVTPCRRQRRRKLLTESDFNVLLRISTLPNKENVRIALGKAIGRG